MTHTEAKIIADSLSPDGVRLTTFQLRYPRFIHSEFMTHRLFSRNASSSRAIPVTRGIEAVTDDPVIPDQFLANKPGMQGGEQITGDDEAEARKIWLQARSAAVAAADTLRMLNVHKQYVNRLLEPFATISVVCTATDYANFFALRMHPDAQPEIQALARAMWAAYHGSDPVTLGYDMWHLPYVDMSGEPNMDLDYARRWLAENRPKEKAPGHLMALLTKMSVSRCARVSYMKHDGGWPAIEDDLALYEKLIESRPMHASPAEHQATPDRLITADKWARPETHGNFLGWTQFRQILKGQRSHAAEYDGRRVTVQTSNQWRQLGMC